MTTTSLEQRMRRALAWYPGEWRAQHGEAMLGVLLDQAEAERMPGPSLAQRLNLAWHGLVEWLLGAGTVPFRSLAASSALFGASAFAIFHFVVFAWQPWVEFRNGFFDSPVAWLDLTWLAGAFLFLFGWRRSSVAVLAVTASGALLMPLLVDPAVSPTDYSAAVDGVWAAAWKTSAAVFVVAAVFVLSGQARTPLRPARTVVAVVGGAAAMCAAFCVGNLDLVMFTPLGIRGLSWSLESVFQTGPYGGGWGESYLWGRFGLIGQDAPAFALPAAALLIWVISWVRSARSAARATAIMLPWLAFCVFHLAHDTLQSTTKYIEWAHGPSQIITSELRGLSAPTWWMLVTAAAVGCAAFAVVGVRAIARARAEAALAAAAPEAAQPQDQEPLYG